MRDSSDIVIIIISSGYFWTGETCAFLFHSYFIRSVCPWKWRAYNPGNFRDATYTRTPQYHGRNRYVGNFFTFFFFLFFFRGYLFLFLYFFFLPVGLFPPLLVFRVSLSRREDDAHTYTRTSPSRAMTLQLRLTHKQLSPRPWFSFVH